MELTILIIESLSNFILIAILVRSELKIIKGKKMLLEQREREKQIEKDWKESTTFLQQVEIAERNLSKRNYISETEEFDDNFFEKRKERKKKSLEALAMCMGVSVEELNKIRNFDLFPSDRIKRITEVYLMKPDIDFAISYSPSDIEVEWARKQVWGEKSELKEFQIKKEFDPKKNLSISTDIIRKNELKCGKVQCFMYSKHSEHNCMSEEFVNCQHFFQEEKPIVE